jgi:hypothetical protein
MTRRVTQLLSPGIAHLKRGGTIEEYMRQVHAERLPLAEREELHDLMETAADLTHLLETAIPLPRAQAVNRARFLGEAAQLREERLAHRTRRGLSAPVHLLRVLLGLTLALALVLTAGGGVVRAAAASLPGSSLYPFKLAVEDARLGLAFDPATRAHFGQIFVLYSDPAGEIERALERKAPGKPALLVTDEYGTVHRVWNEGDPVTIRKIVSALRDKPLVIADGHHRYETALAYRDFCRAQGKNDARADYVMMTLVRKESAGLTILPTHRVVHSLPGFDWNGFLPAAGRYFTREEISAAGDDVAAKLIARLAEAGREGPSLLAYAGPGRAALLRPRPDLDVAVALPELPAGLRCLDVVILHRLLLEQVLGIDRRAVEEEKNLRYIREAADALAQVERGEAQVAFLMNPTPVEDVWTNALAGNPLPQKSTDFYPKLLSGLTVYWLDNPAGI